ncbi:MAG: 16S rRNA (uracil(1498)-N(3))-methyltransferase [Gammaproteobacteria bacterium]|nr:16S rRNA (uracil(1498)-N(3))-methyltransferase [Gammaproteobacteria bacterium]
MFNGDGGEFVGHITTISRSMVSVQIDAFVDVQRESPIDVHIGLALTKRDAMDVAIQKATELGARTITPVISQHNAASQKSLPKRYEHWLGVVRSAAEQCERTRLPVVNEVVDFPAFIASANAELKLIAHPGEGNPFDGAGQPASVLILVGPEGGFSEEEVERALDAGYRVVGLGPRILRADTAPLVLLTLAQATWGDLFYSSPRTFATDHST